MTGIPPRHDRDRRTRRAALGVGLWVGVASAAVLLAVTATTVVLLVTVSRPPRPGPGGGRGDERIIGLFDIVPLISVLGILGVVALALLAWWGARRATAPLEQALRLQRSFVADASHELRTPLTTLTSRIQLAEHRAQRGGDVASTLAEARADAAAMETVLTDLLAAAESAGRTAPDTWASVGDSVRNAAAVIGPRAAERGVALDADIPAGLGAAVDAAALTRALIALIDNATKHSPTGGTVTVTAARAGNIVEIRVTDRGNGMQIDPERAFERFARSPASGSDRGVGLGLALVRDIMDRFHGTATVESTSDAGTVMLLRLPARRRT